ncbi:MULTISPECIES: hypothetical protein [Cryobacterium]|uniref:Secreted protein n=1 Tax=Cryobacterium levicorallinum TaxID=995038 RepID=A0A1I3E309_9MICO|nr:MULTISPECIES: hypothetical protein [Cryobacterium]TFB81483.1 hypothetical protein E3O11_16405 [Cryobacterium levicorallinum]TFD57571.1 hypothetical protein E3T41_13325 [Cryobacterium sp. Hh38]GEP28521.1 hypothetical protein CLE01_31190 [Cryobacterium levicorallinum]SFH93364.1 hypothetical protein SAMN05216274_12246 [Cryobacterium levicorallinum]
MRTFTKATIGFASAGILIAGLAGCSSDAGTTTPAPASSSSSSDSASADPTPLASIPSLSGVDTAVLLDADFGAALTSLGLAAGTVGTATLEEGSLHFPITGGNVDYYDPAEDYRPFVQGSIEHEGSGFSLTAGDIVVELTNFTIDPGTSELFGDVSVNGESAATQALLFDLYGGTLEPLKMDGDNAILTGTTVHISSVAAGLLNSTFSTDAVADQMLVGIATITAATK